MPRIGNQVPTYSWCGSYTRTQGVAAAKLSDAYGLAPFEWQRRVLLDWLALDDDGRLLNALCVLDVQRQNGKTGVCEPRESWGLIYRGEWILHTAQEYQTARLAFNRLRKKFGETRNDPLADFPELNRMVAKYTTSANQMVLDLTNGAHIEFRTRGSNSDMGRGGTFDLVVIDEAQSYTDAQDAALSPLNSAAPSGSPQTILMGTVPDPANAYKGEKFAMIRAGLHDEPYVGACIHEWGSSEPIPDVTDKDLWYERNPSLGLTLLESALQKDVRTMSPDAFAREHLGWWPETAVMTKVIREADWNACATDEPSREGLVVYAVKFSPDGSTGTLAACHKPTDGIPFVYVVESRSLSHGIGWLVDKLADNAHKAAQIVIDGQSNAQTLNDRLLDRHVPAQAIIRPRTNDCISAYATMANAVKERRVLHYGQPALDASATRTKKRRIGSNGGWGFQSTDEADASLIESCSLALWSALNTKRKPGRKAVVF